MEQIDYIESVGEKEPVGEQDGGMEPDCDVEPDGEIKADGEMETEEMEYKPLELPSGRLIVQYLQKMKSGATMGEILQYLRTEYGKDSDELTSSVISVLENGTALGFLERKGSHYMNWSVREACGKRRRRRSCCCRRRKRKIRRRRSCCARKRQRRRC